ncbi:hypothetical protein J2X65_000772 [Ancylobacter sp. 3268]|uniref:hypothetical protein n=1 Tax=Ancylobacter sp. 3268 TaxID=2817752 RepID=UPI00285EE6E1|nr:hypothetical protein [Ancylobacter sp. 3268]MDR6951424.1 hypothetical protein [Ancylobacter sp. 3268]
MHVFPVSGRLRPVARRHGLSHEPAGAHESGSRHRHAAATGRAAVFYCGMTGRELPIPRFAFALPSDINKLLTKFRYGFTRSKPASLEGGSVIDRCGDAIRNASAV